MIQCPVKIIHCQKPPMTSMFIFTFLVCHYIVRKVQSPRLKKNCIFSTENIKENIGFRLGYFYHMFV